MAPIKQSPLILYLVMLLGLVLGFLYNSQSDPAASVPAVPANLQLTTLRGLDGLKVDYTVLESDQFEQLRVFGELPVDPDGGGKENPFQ
jgi:hypothetical protein